MKSQREVGSEDVAGTERPSAQCRTTAAGAGPFVGSSEMHVRVNSHDWASTSIGAFDRWPQSLRATAKTLLGSRYPMILLWGPELLQIYNEAYIGLIGDKHPGALGRSIRETQSESWSVIGPMIHEVMSTGVPNWVPAQMLPLERSGYREESYFSLSYSAVENDDGCITGMLCVCSEVTQQILSERRTRLLRDLAMRAGDTRSVDSTCRDIAAALAEQPLDIPFALLYLRAGNGHDFTLAESVGVADDEREYFRSSAIAGNDAFGEALVRSGCGRPGSVEGMEQYAGVSGGPWGDRVQRAISLPIAGPDPAKPLGVLIAAVSPNRALDEGYGSFFDLLASQVSVALRNARAYEDERKRAETLAELDRAKTAFFNNVSHEFRTPLTLMLAPLEDLLASHQATGNVRRELEVVHRNAERLLRLVNALLDFSRIESDRIDASFEPTDLSMLTTDLASSFRSVMERAGLTLSVDCPPLSEPVSVDREMWEKIVLNLLSNAFKFTFEGGVEVQLRERESEVVLHVRDSGVGIPASEVPHVFERFYQVKGAHGRTHEGSGIGLALVQELVKLHDGRIEASSIEGRGTAFTVALPRGGARARKHRGRPSRDRGSMATHARVFVDEARRWTSSEGASPGQEQTNAATTERPRILVVDDNADMREYLDRVLTPSFEVVTAMDGQAALDLVHARDRFELVLTDVMMPRLGGFGLLRALREDPRTRTIPVVILSARAGEEASVEGLEAGADDYLVKPFSTRELVARTRSAIALSRMREEVATLQAIETSLKQSIRARDEFLSIASHELRTPLTPLQIQISTLERHANGIAKDADAAAWLKKRLDNVRRQSERLNRLVDDLLDLSGVVSGEIALQLGDVDLVAIVHDVVKHFETTGAVRRSGCEVRVHAATPVVGCWDRDRLEQLTASLVSNALKYGAGSPIDIAVTEEGRIASLAVADRGIGISSDAQSRIFERFERFERATSARHYGGFGAGLYVARQVAQALGGSIEIESALGAGATFRVSLPLDGPLPQTASTGPSPPEQDDEALH